MFCIAICAGRRQSWQAQAKQRSLFTQAKVKDTYWKHCWGEFHMFSVTTFMTNAIYFVICLCILVAYFAVCCKLYRLRTGPEVLKLFPCSTWLSTIFFLLINVKMPTILGILTFISMINTTSQILLARNFFWIIYKYLILWAVEILCSVELSMKKSVITSVHDCSLCCVLEQDT